MSDDSDPLTTLSTSIADGESVDWEAVRAQADEDVRRLLDHLRVVAAINDVHRAQADESAPRQPQSPSKPAAPGTAAGEPGRRWGHLLIVRQIGAGAFGEVYEAVDTWLDHPRALKLLRPEVSDRAALQEAKKLARVRHPNVVTVHGADRHDGRIGFWMDLIAGQTLEQRVRQGRLSAGEATHIGKEVCRALAAVHEANIIHRDVKAQNVMRASDGGGIILVDFGAGEFRDAPNDGKVQGTPLYLAPEIFDGAAATVQTDVYALGVLLYYLVSGRFPVQAASFKELHLAHQRKEVRRLRDARADLPDSFVAIVERAIDQNPAHRFQSAGDFHGALLLDHEPLSSQPAATTAPVSAGRSDTISVPLSPQQRLWYVLLTVVTILAALELFGFVGYKTFETAFNIETVFTAGPLQCLRLGIEALAPFVFNWLVGAVFFSLLAGVRLVLPSRMKQSWSRFVTRVEKFPSATVATLIPLAGGVCWVAITWVYRTIFITIDHLHNTTLTGAPLPGGLDSVYYYKCLYYNQFAAILSFLLLYAAWRWWPHLERHADGNPVVRRMQWATVTVAVVVIALAVAPRRLAFDRFDMTMFDNHLSFVIGSDSNELLLYAAETADTVRQRVRRDAPGLTPAGTGRIVSR